MSLPLVKVEQIDWGHRILSSTHEGDFDILFADSSHMQAVASIGRYVKTAKVLYLQEPHRGSTKPRARGFGFPSRRCSCHLAALLEEDLCYQNADDYDLWRCLAADGATFFGLAERLVR